LSVELQQAVFIAAQEMNNNKNKYTPPLPPSGFTVDMRLMDGPYSKQKPKCSEAMDI